MKAKTNLKAGMTFAECDANRNYWKQAVQSGTCYAPQPTPTPPPYPPAPSGQCPSTWSTGMVKESSGNGFYGSIQGADNLTHYFNYGYTKFFPTGQGVSIGQTVNYAPFPPGNERAGKAACITS